MLTHNHKAMRRPGTRRNMIQPLRNDDAPVSGRSGGYGLIGIARA